jgi:hypothetical protein
LEGVNIDAGKRRIRQADKCRKGTIMMTKLAASLATGALLLTLAAPDRAWAEAGVTNFAFGDVSLRKANGKSDPLLKGRTVDSGDAIVTGPGAQAQIRFTDGGMVAVLANSQLKITNYADKQDPKTDNFLVDLARGGMRAITGLIGKRNHDNYKVTTNTATIGIRGSSFLIVTNDDGSVSVNAEQDAIVVCSNSGCTGLTAGESAVVKDKGQAPERTLVRPLPDSFLAPTAAPVTYTGNRVFVANDLQAEFIFYESPNEKPTENANNAASAIFVDQALVAFADTDAPRTKYSGSNISSFNQTGTPSDADYIGWGYWANATAVSQSGSSTWTDVHYIVGRPTPALSMPLVGSFTYDLIGATAPTMTTASGAHTTGQLVSASLQVDFNLYGFQTDVTTRFGGQSYALSVENYLQSNNARFNGIAVSGMFTGAGAAKAGIVYQYLGAGATINGAAAFKKGAPSQYVYCSSC